MSFIIIFLFLLLIVYGIALVKNERARKEQLRNIYNTSQNKCNVMLISTGKEKIKIIKTFKKYVDWDLSLAKEKVELPLPALVIVDMPKNLAYALQQDLEKLDTTIKIIRNK